MQMRRWFSLVAVLGLVAATTQIVNAQQNYAGSGDADLLNRISTQEQRIAELESQIPRRQQPFAMEPASWNYDSMVRRLEVLEAMVAAGDDKDGDGEDKWVDSHSQKWETKWGGRVHLDYVNFVGQNAGADAELGGDDLEDYAEFRRLRLQAEGKGYGVFEFKVEVDFEPEVDAGADVEGLVYPDDFSGLRFGSVSVKDVYIGMQDIPVLGTVRMGHFKEPFSLEELTSSRFISFMERGLPNEVFVPGRKLGMAATRHSDCPKWWIGYGAFFNAFDDVAKERTDDLQGIDLTGRVAYLPIYANDGRHLLHLGAGLQYADQADDEVRFRARPEVHETRRSGGAGLHQTSVRLIDTGVLAADDYTVANLEAAWVMGPASIQTELFATRVDDVGEDFYGMYVFGSYFLTGEHRAYKASSASFDRVTPLENFWIVNTPDGRCIGTGAWETLIRWSYLDLSEDTNGDDEAGVQNDLTLGMNWYWNPYSKMMFNYIHSWNSYSNGDPTAELDILAMSVRFDF